MAQFDGNTYNEERMRSLMADNKVTCNNLSAAHLDAEIVNKNWDKYTKYPGLMCGVTVSFLAIVFAVHPYENSEIILGAVAALGTLISGYNAINDFSGKAAAHNFSAGGYGGLVSQISSAYAWDVIPDKQVQSIIERIGFQDQLAPTIPASIAAKYGVEGSKMDRTPTPLPKVKSNTVHVDTQTSSAKVVGVVQRV